MGVVLYRAVTDGDGAVSCRAGEVRDSEGEVTYGNVSRRLGEVVRRSAKCRRSEVAFGKGKV